MKDTKSGGFSGRALTSAATTLCFVVLAITGVGLFVTPPGRFAYWTGWRLLGLSKDDWSGLHIWFGVLFLIASGFHIWLNWRVLLSYFKSTLTRHFAFRAEWMLALVLCGVVATGTLAEVPPFSSLIAWNETIKQSWEQRSVRAPIPHAELLSLRELAQKSELELETLRGRLEAAGIKVSSPDETLRELAYLHGCTPAQLYEIAIPNDQQPGRRRTEAGGGMGRKTLRQFCSDEGMDLAVALERLRAAGLDAEAGLMMREIAESGGLRPPELREILSERP